MFESRFWREKAHKMTVCQDIHPKVWNCERVIDREASQEILHSPVGQSNLIADRLSSGQKTLTQEFSLAQLTTETSGIAYGNCMRIVEL
jgi:hypothetical protein